MSDVVERVVEFDIGCVPEAQTSGPRLLMTERVAFLLFNSVRVRYDGSRTPAGRAIVEMRNCSAVRFGHPGNEALATHPLHGRGLSHDGVFEVLDSSWVRELREKAEAAAQSQSSTAPPAPASKSAASTPAS